MYQVLQKTAVQELEKLLFSSVLRESNRYIE